MKGFSTKAETLQFLYTRQKAIKARVLPVVIVKAIDFRAEPTRILSELATCLPESSQVIVRSSAYGEDGIQSSMAGQYTSKIVANTKTSIASAVTKVLSSYGEIKEKDQFFVQPVLTEVTLAGVAFTAEPNTGARYFVINYDESGSTSSVTAGEAKTKLFYWAQSEHLPKNERLAKLCQTLLAMEKVLDCETLDVEFAFSAGELYILQARPLLLRRKLRDVTKDATRLGRVRKKIHDYNRPKLFLYGKHAIFGVMPDWNPAEMIGLHPKSLALSLYKEIITDNVWAYQRDRYGYMNLRSFPLMVDFCGLPYIDVRVSFNSFIPKDLSPQIAEKLVNYYLETLTAHPELHDKIEFAIVFSCYTFDLPKRLQVLKSHGFTNAEIEAIAEALKRLTNNIINNKTGIWREDAQKIEKLSQRFEAIMQSDLDDIERIYWLLEDCKRYGTLPFAGLARAAFIAVSILRSMVAEEFINKEEYQTFLLGLTTVSKKLSQDIQRLLPSEFLRIYGHLRPGTYDIESARYDEAPERYFEFDRMSKKEYTGGGYI